MDLATFYYKADDYISKCRNYSNDALYISKIYGCLANGNCEVQDFVRFTSSSDGNYVQAIENAVSSLRPFTTDKKENELFSEYKNEIVTRVVVFKRHLSHIVGDATMALDSISQPYPTPHDVKIKICEYQQLLKIDDNSSLTNIRQKYDFLTN